MTSSPLQNPTNDEDSYLSISQGVHQSTKVKGSRFLGYAAPVQNKEDAHSYLEELSKKYYDATHVCYAYQYGLSTEAVSRYSDAGEPSGTAGLPIMEAITGRHFNFVICVVVRYFGGTKLGTGGLSRAYSECASITLDDANPIRHYIEEVLEIRHPYDLTGQVMHVLSQPGVTIVESKYDTDVQVKIRVRKSKLSTIKKMLIDQSSGQASFLEGKTTWI